jgi:hypothetical protein
MSEGLRIAMKHSKSIRFTTLEGMYAESLVAQKLLENGRNVVFHAPDFDLLVDGGLKIEVKCGLLYNYGAGASFNKGTQIIERKFDYCVFVVIDRENFKPEKFFIFTRKQLAECTKLRPRLTTKETPSILFYYKDLKEFQEDARKAGEPIFDIEIDLSLHPELYENRWDKIQ